MACTKSFEETGVRLSLRSGPHAGERAVLRIVDAPGLGESVALDPAYLGLYEQNLPKCDAILWISAARNRAVALEQTYLEKLLHFTDRMIFGLGQADLVEPRDWNEAINLPSARQEAHLGAIAEDRAAAFRDVIGDEVSFVPFSSARRYNLQVLFSSIIDRVPFTRAWIYSALKGFDPDDWMTETSRELSGRDGEPPRSRRARLLRRALPRASGDGEQGRDDE